MPHLSDKTLGWSKRAKKAQPYEEVDFRGGRSREPEVLVRATFLSAARAIIKTRIVRRIDRKSRDPFVGSRPSVRRGSRSPSGRHARARGERRCSVRTVRSGRRRCAGPGNAGRIVFGSPRAAWPAHRRLRTRIGVKPSDRSRIAAPQNPALSRNEKPRVARGAGASFLLEKE